MCMRNTGSREDYTEAFLLIISAVCPPRPWPSPPMSSWSRFSTWTSVSDGAPDPWLTSFHWGITLYVLDSYRTLKKPEQSFNKKWKNWNRTNGSLLLPLICIIKEDVFVCRTFSWFLDRRCQQKQSCIDNFHAISCNRKLKTKRFFFFFVLCWIKEFAFVL